jgi:chromosomal replication initiator protein
MEGSSALYDARRHATPTQLIDAARHAARLDRIAAAANPDAPLIQLSSPAVRTEPVTAKVLIGSPLEDRFKFENFMVGRSNAVVTAAARQISSRHVGERIEYNPLFIHSGAGLGKTHLLQATAAAALEGGRRAAYLSAEAFAQSFNVSIKAQALPALKDALRSLDMLIIDDIQLIQGRSIASELCFTINSLIDAGRQVVIGSDRAPQELDTFDDRARSRLYGGLVLELGSLGEELRLDILRHRVDVAKGHHAPFDVPESVLKHIAMSISNNGRALESAVTRLLVQSKLGGDLLTVESVEHSLRDLMVPKEGRSIRIEDIQRVVAKHCGVRRDDMRSARRTANVVRPRQIAMYLCKMLTLKSLPEIGRSFGGRDHTTILHAFRKMERLVSSNEGVAKEMDFLRIQIVEQ